MELKSQRSEVMDVNVLMFSTMKQKRCPIQKQIFCNVNNGMKMFEIIKLKAMHHNIIVIQVLDRVYNVIFPDSSGYNNTKPGL